MSVSNGNEEVRSLTYSEGGEVHILHSALSDNDLSLIELIRDRLATIPGADMISPLQWGELVKVATLVWEQERNYGLPSFIFAGASKDKCPRILNEIKRALAGGVTEERALTSFIKNLSFLTDEELQTLQEMEGLKSNFKKKVTSEILERDYHRSDAQYKLPIFRESRLLEFTKAFIDIDEFAKAHKTASEIYSKSAKTILLYLIEQGKEAAFLEMGCQSKWGQMALFAGIDSLFQAKEHERAVRLISWLIPEAAQKKIERLQYWLEKLVRSHEIEQAKRYADAWPIDGGKYFMIIHALIGLKDWDNVFSWAFNDKILPNEARFRLLHDLMRYLYGGKAEPKIPHCSSFEEVTFIQILRALIAYHGKSLDWAEQAARAFIPNGRPFTIDLAHLTAA